jgi:hypothetical protein
MVAHSGPYSSNALILEINFQHIIFWWVVQKIGVSLQLEICVHFIIEKNISKN